MPTPSRTSQEPLRGELTFVPADPPRLSLFANWGPGIKGPGSVELAVPAGSQVRRRSVPCRRLNLIEAMGVLAANAPGPTASESARVWSAALRLGLELIGRGRLVPTRTTSGFAAWTVGPLDAADRARLDALVALLPPQAHCAAVGTTNPVRIHDSRWMVTEAWNGLADLLVRTSAATTVHGAAPFSQLEPSRIADDEEWHAPAEPPEDTSTVTVLRLEPPNGPDGRFRLVLVGRSAVDPSLQLDAEQLWTSPASILRRFGPNPDTDLLLALRRASRVWTPLSRLLEQRRPSSMALDDDEVTALLGTAAERLAEAGIELLLPTALTVEPIEVRAALGTQQVESLTSAGLQLDQLLQFRWTASVGGSALSESEIAELAEAKRPLVQLRGRWVVADRKVLERLRRAPRQLRSGQALAAALTGSLDIGGETIEVDLTGSLAELPQRIAALGDHHREIPEPDGLEAVLRPYQRRGAAWLDDMRALGLGGCLADDMGLGKTVQVIAAHLAARARQRDPGPMLVVCPTSLLGNWQRELRRFAPSIAVRRYHGTERSLADLDRDEAVLVTYGLVRRDRAELAKVHWSLVVADEAQAIKNPYSRTAREIRAIGSDSRIALTGTPVENRLADLWAILDWTTPGLLGSLDHFQEHVAAPIERRGDPERTEQLAATVRPFLMRRRKIDPDIAPDLPPKTETDVVVPLTEEQGTLYEAVVRSTLEEIADAKGISRRGLVLKLLTGLKQICNHPAHYLSQKGPLTGRSGKLAAFEELVEVINSEGDSCLVFTQYVSMARLLEARLAELGISSMFLHGSTPATEREAMVERFQAGEVPVFLLSLKAGGTGLNLTRATHVIHYDRWWNPAVEDQATDRAYRIGQDRPVMVHRLITEGTVEDRIATLLASKRSLADAVVSSGEAWLAELSDDELRDLVALKEFQ